MTEFESALAEAWAALRSRDWAGARLRFEACLQKQDSASAHDGLGQALWWLNEITPAHEHRAAAYRLFAEQNDVRRAALIAAWLAREQVFLHGNASGMQGWFARAERLLTDAANCAERGWYAVYRASMLDAPPALAETSRATIALARACNDRDLEAVALAFLGMAEVAQGNVIAGMLRLDEAMAMATAGEVAEAAAVSEIFCVMLSACELAGDLVRTEHWCAAAADYAERYHCTFLAAYCRTTYGGLLTAGGRWQEAEAELLQAIAVFDAGHRGLRVHAVLRLADLRVRQGRLEEAAVLLAGYEDQGEAQLPLARLHLAKGEHDLARAVLAQVLQPDHEPGLHDAPALLLLVEVAMAEADTVGANRAVGLLAALAAASGSELLQAQAELAGGKVLRARGEPGAADAFGAALRHLRTYEQSFLAGCVRLEMGRTLAATDRAGAITWTRAALATFERLGARAAADEAAALLRTLGAGTRPGPRLAVDLTRRELEVLHLIAAGLGNREIAARLFISAKTAEHHVSRILAKLGARSRAEAAAFAATLPPTAATA